jgi:hypothetical protein
VDVSFDGSFFSGWQTWENSAAQNRTAHHHVQRALRTYMRQLARLVQLLAASAACGALRPGRAALAFRAPAAAGAGDWLRVRRCPHAAPSMSAAAPPPTSVLYLKGQSQGCWLPPATGGAERESFEEFCGFVERIVHRHHVRRIVWDGDPPEPGTFAEFFPELFCRLGGMRMPGDDSMPLIDEIKAFRLKGTSRELEDMMADAFVRRNLGPLKMQVHPYAGGVLRESTVPGECDPVRITVEESDVPDEGRNPYIALGWYSLTEDVRKKGESKVVVCLGGGLTCRFEFERARKESVPSSWYCLYLPPRPDASDATLQSSINAAHAADACGDVPADEWKFGGLMYDTAR